MATIKSFEGGEADYRLHEAAVNSQLSSLESARNARSTSNFMTAVGWTTGLASIIGKSVSDTLKPYVHGAALKVLGATASVSGAMLPIAIGVMAWHKVRQWATEYSRRQTIKNSLNGTIVPHRRSPTPQPA